MYNGIISGLMQRAGKANEFLFFVCPDEPVNYGATNYSGNICVANETNHVRRIGSKILQQIFFYKNTGNTDYPAHREAKKNASIYQRKFNRTFFPGPVPVLYKSYIFQVFRCKAFGGQ